MLMKTRFATNQQIIDATLKMRNKGTPENLIKKVLKDDLGLTANPHKKVSYDAQKRLIKEISSTVEEKGGSLKGYGKFGKQRKILSAVQQDVKSQQEQANPEKKQTLLQKLRQTWQPKINPNQPQISTQGQEAIISGSNLAQQKTIPKTQAKNQNLAEQDKKILPMSVENRQQTLETPEVDLNAEPGFESKKAA